MLGIMTDEWSLLLIQKFWMKAFHDLERQNLQFRRVLYSEYQSCSRFVKAEAFTREIDLQLGEKLIIEILKL